MREKPEKAVADIESSDKPQSRVTAIQHIKASDKSSAQHAENIAYTINHALACTATDFIDPWIGRMTQKYLRQRVSIGCGHDHSADHGTAWQGVVGELVGDFGAVPVTVAVQHYAPWVGPLRFR